MDFTKIRQYYNGKRVFITGHTGFKGSWMCMLLKSFGAEIFGYALEPDTEPALFNILKLSDDIHHTIGDIRNYVALEKSYRAASPDIVFHLAAQPIVRESYKNPRYTYETNIMGTVNVLECLRLNPGAKSFLNVTTDKVYENSDQANHSFKEEEKLDGFDPYSNSKSCSELVTHSYQKSFFSGKDSTPISTARAGNVIGGGDFADDRIIPDCVRATIKKESIIVRNPHSTRPYQHVLEPVSAYLMIAMEQAADHNYSGYYNIGPYEDDAINTGMLADMFVKSWGEGSNWKDVSESNEPHEAKFLKLDCTKARMTFGWEPVWHVDEAVCHTVAWYKAWSNGADMRDYTYKQLQNYIKEQ